jgi:hypothetical protein
VAGWGRAGGCGTQTCTKPNEDNSHKKNGEHSRFEIKVKQSELLKKENLLCR